MLTRKIVVLFSLIFAVIALPLIMAQSSGGAAIAGLSAGLFAPLDNTYHLILFLAISAWAAYGGRESVITYPAAFMLMLLVSSSMLIDTGAARSMALGGILLFSMLVSMTSGRLQLTCLIVIASIGFYLGGRYAPLMPEYADPLYFVVGTVVSISLMMAIVVSMAWMIFREIAHNRLERKKISEAEAAAAAQA